MDAFDHEHSDRGSAKTDPVRHLETLEDEVATLKRRLRSADSDGDADTNVDAATTDLRARFEAAAGELQAAVAAANGGHEPINRRTGGTITPLEPVPADVALADIAHALANLTRFTGQGRDHYSVARHAVHVSHEVEARGGSPDAIRWGLLHDATEAYLADVPAPVKRSLPGYTHAESELAAAVRDAFEIELSRAERRLVHAADKAVGRDELARHFPDGGFERPALEFDADALEREWRTGAASSDTERFVDRANELDIECD
ncbi:HD domain-containing protein [Natronolimnohabitans innermongolicus]|uniref:Metal dependent phosphohydrolase n=1 Tax=Natronolimnohabitans innermongolicus JCM 12255 TaxID=1227499 RepID=L9WYA9_9EURY|nr:hypothetical protein [Natronolimnohabitans innermongolicus]ELY54450.1 hypothetical protein C493_12589 [Natronolimnohabitans innermongolicus JCM 12255]